MLKKLISFFTNAERKKFSADEAVDQLRKMISDGFTYSESDARRLIKKLIENMEYASKNIMGSSAGSGSNNIQKKEIVNQIIAFMNIQIQLENHTDRGRKIEYSTRRFHLEYSQYGLYNIDESITVFRLEENKFKFDSHRHFQEQS